MLWPSAAKRGILKTTTANLSDMAKNPNAKRAGELSEYRPEDIQNLARCMKDPIFFMENYIMVKHPKRGLVPLVLYDYQKRMVDALMNHKDIVMLASRQMGKCCQVETTINTVTKPSGFKKLLLKVVDRDTHDRIFGNQPEKNED